MRNGVSILLNTLPAGVRDALGRGLEEPRVGLPGWQANSLGQLLHQQGTHHLHTEVHNQSCTLNTAHYRGQTTGFECKK